MVEKMVFMVLIHLSRFTESFKFFLSFLQSSVNEQSHRNAQHEFIHVAFMSKQAKIPELINQLTSQKKTWTLRIVNLYFAMLNISHTLNDAYLTPTNIFEWNISSAPSKVDEKINKNMNAGVKKDIFSLCHWLRVAVIFTTKMLERSQSNKTWIKVSEIIRFASYWNWNISF